ncbi:flavin reductase family protein [Pseudogracilibacillus auburnensis]|uniref:Flavin reductase (DIM6/NTAB) family NADH-FMN oxidoreductase RutF n=1 Tax=Pseudogracilibacillus auburnensis TaxID=1494959 RepID=A0A2V3VVB4_9BACI|nr:flavin reductase family protein [Pseudogracilibacillus auburnensis]PXW85596.1 flavin reductase (DIM6/NTAB) family NADH-FMN oxidoreductase RutF [Pseudogracilibacillus auburnensis]
MLSIDPKYNSERDNYKLLIGSIVPRPIAFVTSKSKDNIINGAPFSYFNIVTANPPMISISVQRQGLMQKDTARNIIQQKEFVVHIVDEDNVGQINETAASLPANESEIEKAQLTLLPSETISVPGVKEAKVRFECMLEKGLELGGGEGHASTDLIIGKITRIHIDEKVYDEGKIIYEELNAVSRLAGNDYAKIGDVFAMERPR